MRARVREHHHQRNTYRQFTHLPRKFGHLPNPSYDIPIEPSLQIKGVLQQLMQQTLSNTIRRRMLELGEQHPGNNGYPLPNIFVLCLSPEPCFETERLLEWVLISRKIVPKTEQETASGQLGRYDGVSSTNIPPIPAESSC
ncbi:hypothetical protein JTB14_021965 [Gonioctena quinquepunctata]|nr:hypothetical protein JTB14_021965 [Gonioctena quinquepunctata]